MDVKYTPNGPKGRTCGECINYRPRTHAKGDCFGNEFSMGGRCNFFKKKVLV